MSERIVFIEEASPSQYLRLIVSGVLDEGLLDALENFIGRQRKRLKAAEDAARYPLPKELA